MSKDAEVVEARQKQSKESRRATFEALKKKPRAQEEVSIKVPDEDGNRVEMTMLFRAIGSREYDSLISKNPPNTEQRAEGNIYNPDTFGPALLSVVCIDPEMTPEEWSEIYNSPDWNRGEVFELFLTAQQLCNRGLDVSFTKRD